jgi:hypothetical protein
MSQPISFPFSSPQVQAAERVQSQLQHAGGNLQHALAGEAEKNRREKSETVNETPETEDPRVDQDGHQRQQHESEEQEKKASPQAKGDQTDSSGKPDDDDMQGRFINLVV